MRQYNVIDKIKEVGREAFQYISNHSRELALVLSSAAIMTACTNSETPTYNSSITPTRTDQPTATLTYTPENEESPSPTLTETLQSTATQDPRYDGNAILESLVFYANVNDINKYTLVNADFYQADYEDISIRIKEAVKQDDGSFIPGEVISDVASPDKHGGYRLNVNVPFLESIYGFVEVGQVVDGEFIELPYVGLSEGIASANMPVSEEKLGMNFVQDTIPHGEEEYPVMRQVINISEVEQPNDEGEVMPGYREFIFLNVPYSKLEEITEDFDVQSPSLDLIQWVGIIAEGQEPYKLAVGHPMELSQVVEGEDLEIKKKDYAGLFGNWTFKDTGVGMFPYRLKREEVEGEFLCRPLAHSYYENGWFENFVEDVIVPLDNNYRQFFMDREDFQVDEIALLCGVRPTKTPKQQRPTPTPYNTPTPHNTPTPYNTPTPHNTPTPYNTPTPHNTPTTQPPNTPTPPVLESPTPNDPVTPTPKPPTSEPQPTPIPPTSEPQPTPKPPTQPSFETPNPN